jgi:hypothetical protein
MAGYRFGGSMPPGRCVLELIVGLVVGDGGYAAWVSSTW